MRIAIPLFGTRISPRFDGASDVMLVWCGCPQDRPLRRHVVTLEGTDVIERIHQLAGLAVDLVICGGISNEESARLHAAGIDVIPWVTGDVREVLKLFRQGRLKTGMIVSPGKQPERWEFCDDSG
jgi:predicted Fe-Mo cluster-binding NifX family protein